MTTAWQMPMAQSLCAPRDIGLDTLEKGYEYFIIK